MSQCHRSLVENWSRVSVFEQKRQEHVRVSQAKSKCLIEVPELPVHLLIHPYPNELRSRAQSSLHSLNVLVNQTRVDSCEPLNYIQLISQIVLSKFCIFVVASDNRNNQYAKIPRSSPPYDRRCTMPERFQSAG